jgi:3-dehydroquinate synthase
MLHEARRLRVDVPAAPGDYDVVCGRGALTALPALLEEIGAAGRVLVLSDATVAPLHGRRVVTLLGAAGWDVLLWAMPAGEAHKTLETVSAAYSWLAGQRVERGETIVALGGGVVGDLAGFVAATYLRGLRLVQLPTTLVSQVDSALGGKVGVDLPAGKNLVGAFHQPALVLADVDLLATLPEREWRAGLAEVIKHGVIRDRGLLDLLERRRADIQARDPGVVAGMVAQAAAVKVAVVMEDPLERGLRRILNYGHTLGHAIERAAGYGVVLHGEAVAWGMAAAARIGAHLGTCDGAFVAWQDALLRAYGLCMPLPALQADAVLQATRLDKKTAAGHLHWVLPRGPGEVTITHDVPSAAVHAAVDWLVAEGR